MEPTSDFGVMDYGAAVIGLGILAMFASACLFGLTFTAIAAVLLGCASLGLGCAFREWVKKKIAESS